MDPKRLIEKAKLGDKDAYGALYSQYYLPVFRYIYLRVNDKTEAEDLAQTVFLKVYQSLSRYQNTDADPLAYFFTVARNSIIDFYRQKKASSLEGNEEALGVIDKSDPEDDLSKKEDREKVIAALKRLPDDQKDVLILKFIEELPNVEIAKMLGKNEPAIRQIQHRALGNLKKILEEKNDKRV